MDWYRVVEHAFISQRLSLDRWEDDGLAALYDEYVRAPRIAAAHRIADLAVERGQIGSGVDFRIAIELLLGAMSSHFNQTRKTRYEALMDTFPEYEKPS